MTEVSGVVQAVSKKTVNGKYGPSEVVSFMVDGEWYNGGFKKYGAIKGDNVVIEFDVGKYGKDIKSMNVGSGAPASAVPPSSVSYSGAGFPIPPLDKQRAIIRQNSLTNAREYVATSLNSGVDIDHLNREAGLSSSNDDAVQLIIAIAGKFEEYSAGDIERNMLEDEA